MHEEHRWETRFGVSPASHGDRFACSFDPNSLSGANKLHFFASVKNGWVPNKSATQAACSVASRGGEPGLVSNVRITFGPSRHLLRLHEADGIGAKQTSRTIYDGVDAPPTASMCQSGGVEHHLGEASVSEVITVGLDIAKHVFHAHGADGRGRAIFSKRISRRKLLDFFAAQPNCTVALEACGGAHHWARQLTQLGHEVRLIPPAGGQTAARNPGRPSDYFPEYLTKPRSFAA
jgi:hypothetical protein